MSEEVRQFPKPEALKTKQDYAGDACRNVQKVIDRLAGSYPPNVSLPHGFRVAIHDLESAIRWLSSESEP